MRNALLLDKMARAGQSSDWDKVGHERSGTHGLKQNVGSR